MPIFDPHPTISVPQNQTRSTSEQLRPPHQQTSGFCKQCANHTCIPEARLGLVVSTRRNPSQKPDSAAANHLATNCLTAGLNLVVWGFPNYPPKRRAEMRDNHGLAVHIHTQDDLGGGAFARWSKLGRRPCGVSCVRPPLCPGPCADEVLKLLAQLKLLLIGSLHWWLGFGSLGLPPFTYITRLLLVLDKHAINLLWQILRHDHWPNLAVHAH